MNEWATKGEWNLAETCVESMTIAELLNFASKGVAVTSFAAIVENSTLPALTSARGREADGVV